MVQPLPTPLLVVGLPKSLLFLSALYCAKSDVTSWFILKESIIPLKEYSIMDLKKIIILYMNFFYSSKSSQ